MDVSWWVDLVVATVRDFVLPAVLALVTSAIAIATVWVSLRHSNNLQRAERVAGEEARMAEAYRGAAERVLEIFADFVSIDPSTEDMRDRMRQLRARVTIFQTLTRGESQDRLGVWIALECEYGMHLIMRAMLEAAAMGSAELEANAVGVLMDPAHRWAGETGQTFAKALRPPVDDEWVQARVEVLAAALKGKRRDL
jgi:hypothetical protein